MKVNDVPQDEAFLEEGKIRDLCYVVDEKGQYTKVLSKGWKPKNDAIRLAWSTIYNEAEKTRNRVLAGELSPVAFYMEINVMGIHMLAGYMNLPRRKVRKHLKMKAFKKLKPEILSRYAEVFGIETADLTETERLRERKPEHEDQFST